MLTDPSGTLSAYLRLGGDALAGRARRAVATLGNCRACPRDCGVNRLEDHWAACKTGRYAVVSSFFPEINRTLTSAEFREAWRIASDLGLQRLDVRRPHPRLRRRMLLVSV